MGTHKVVISYEECYMGIRAFFAAVAVSNAIRELESSVEAFNNLLQPAIFTRDRVIVGKSDHLNKIKVHILQHKLLLGKLVGSIAIGSEFQSFSWELLELGERHTHC